MRTVETRKGIYTNIKWHCRIYTLYDNEKIPLRQRDVHEYVCAYYYIVHKTRYSIPCA